MWYFRARINPMKFLVAGLGNMDEDYFGTRHNIGFEVLDELAKKLNCSFKPETLAHYSQANYKGKKIILIKPTTYMNLSGRAVQYWMNKEKINAEQTIIVLDDLNIDFGKIRIRVNGSDGGHNGLKSIQEHLGHSNYPRIRIGIGNNFSKGKQVNFVLGKWSEDELNSLPKIMTLSVNAILDCCFRGFENAMNAFNKKSVLDE